MVDEFYAGFEVFEAGVVVFTEGVVELDTFDLVALILLDAF